MKIPEKDAQIWYEYINIIYNDSFTLSGRMCAVYSTIRCEF